MVEGDSMLPLLKDGDGLLIDPDAEVVPGDIVLAKHPFKKRVMIVKRLAEVDENGNYVLIGDNPEESSDSRTFGALSKKHILGKAIGKLK